ncbi:SprT family zinc-dependent metalloprotease [uncultured Ellagibacter sp.]|uniref:M48 family metallopeptidase n=1 Tax=uncultured Ellagibacter sp. TaxID=2137580 RepID=UPI002635482E|nr:SprT family zinc-dependent metalloprotease [uncultured Ellagibacter sp.]
MPYSNQSGPVRTRRIAPGSAGASSSADKRAPKRAGCGSQGGRRAGAAGRTRAGARSVADARTLLVDGIEVRLSRKHVKNLNLRISRDGAHVDVSAPSWVSEDEVRDFVRRKAAWIESHLAQAADTPMARASQAKPEEVAAWREVVSACVPALIAAWEPIMGVRAGKLAYRNMTSRWGSCQPSTGRICINVRLALYPPECLEYVVVHELCHLLERGHGPRFHQLMDTFMPDWKQRRAKLR